MRTLFLFLFSASFAIALSGQSSEGLLAMKTDGDIVVLNTAKSTQVLHPLSVHVNLHARGTGFHLNLYDQYNALFASPAVASNGAPPAIPHYPEDELFYYVTGFDANLVQNLRLDQTGLLTYDVIVVPDDHQAVFEVVFVVKGFRQEKIKYLKAEN